jgi:hypothetical protein
MVVKIPKKLEMKSLLPAPYSPLPAPRSRTSFSRDLAHTSPLAARAHLIFPHRSAGRARSPRQFSPLPLPPRSALFAADLTSDFAP